MFQKWCFHSKIGITKRRGAVGREFWLHKPLTNSLKTWSFSNEWWRGRQAGPRVLRYQFTLQLLIARSVQLMFDHTRVRRACILCGTKSCTVLVHWSAKESDVPTRERERERIQRNNWRSQLELCVRGSFVEVRSSDFVAKYIYMSLGACSFGTCIFFLIFIEI